MCYGFTAKTSEPEIISVVLFIVLPSGCQATKQGLHWIVQLCYHAALYPQTERLHILSVTLYPLLVAETTGGVWHLNTSYLLVYISGLNLLIKLPSKSNQLKAWLLLHKRCWLHALYSVSAVCHWLQLFGLPGALVTALWGASVSAH